MPGQISSLDAGIAGSGSVRTRGWRSGTSDYRVRELSDHGDDVLIQRSACFGEADAGG